ncbi:hypothetical protein PS6_003683 [Mucor atramentarius]
MRKREQQQQQQPQPQPQPQSQHTVDAPPFYMDIFEPPPQWRTSVNNTANSINYHAHSPTHRSPIHHQPSLSEIVFQEFNGPSEIQDAYPGVYQQDRLSQQQHQLHHQRSQQFQQLKQHQGQIQLKQQLQQQLQQQHRYQQTQEQNHHYHHHHSRSNSIGSAHDFESAASSLHTISTSPHYLQYDDVEDDNESINKSMFRDQHQQHRHQADNISITTSLFTAVEHLENDLVDEDEEEEHYDDNSSTENQRHGYLPSTTTFQEKAQQQQQQQQQQQVPINELMKKLDIQTTAEWEEIYKEIYATMQKMQELDHKFNAVKATFHLTMEKNYEQMSNHLISQCDALTKEQADYKNKLKSDETNREYLPKNEKIRLNVGGSMFETSLSTLRRDTNSLLATMFSGRHLISAEPDGSYFIDRDPSHFRLVLNYLRDLRIPPTILQDTKICQELLQEAKGLIKILHQQHL